MSGDSGGAGQGAPGQLSGDAPAGTPTRVTRVRAAAAARGIPLATIITSVAVLALAYLAGKLLYRLRDVLLLIFVGGFIALILNPLVVYVQRKVPRRGLAVAIVTVWAALVFVGLVLAFGYPLVTGLTHLAHRLPSYVQDAAAAMAGSATWYAASTWKPGRRGTPRSCKASGRAWRSQL